MCFSNLAPRPSTRHGKANRKMTGKPNRKRGGAEPSPLNRSGDGCRFSAARRNFCRFAVRVFRFLRFWA